MIEIAGLTKKYAGEEVLNRLDLSLPEHQTLCILGKSGCGKSTLLKIMAGLESPDSGSFTVNGNDIFSLPSNERAVVYLSQEPLLFPHLKVGANLGFGLSIRKMKATEIAQKVDALAGKLGIGAHLDKYPHQLSGGQKQRVNFGRALIINPKIMLLDEPFGSLDAHTRHEMQLLFKAISKEFGITALFVTHDIKEALIMGDQLAMMHSGKVSVYPSAQEFIASPETGAQQEMAFWKQFNTGRHEQ